MNHNTSIEHLEEVEFDPETGCYHARWSESNTLGLRIATIIAALTERSPSSLDPLYDTIDPDALETLFRPNTDQDAQVQFKYEGYEVTVRRNGELIFSDIE